MKPAKPIDSLIHTIRGQKVLLDSDLAELYDVSTKRLNEAVKRNIDRFPVDFRFQLTAGELAALRSQSVTLDVADDDTNRSQSVTGSETGRAGNLKSQIATSNETPDANRSQFATGSQKHRDPRFLPWAFTEHGAIMAATILSSPQAVAMSVFVVRAFVQMREQLIVNADVLKRLAEIDKTLLKHDRSLQLIWQEIQPLLSPPPVPPKRRIGFQS